MNHRLTDLKGHTQFRLTMTHRTRRPFNIFLIAIVLLNQFNPALHVLAQKQAKASEEKGQNCLLNKSQESCKECIKAGSRCAWKEAGLNEATKTKCFYLSDDKSISDDDGVIFPAGQEYTEQSGTGKINTYISPEKMKLKLRPGITHEIDIAFTVHKSYPVDLYYLLDLSKSMSDMIKDVALESGNIAIELEKEIGNKLRIGIGSFIEKPTAPFTNNGGQHVFKSWLPLIASDTPDYMKTIQAQLDHLTTILTANNDEEEAGLEALVQVAQCFDEIQWNDISKHIVVFSTDAPSHLAGDARLAGINKPNDLQCHTERTRDPKPTTTVESVSHEYNAALIQDYPSVYDLKDVLDKANIQTIFALTGDKSGPQNKPAVKDNVMQFYKNLTSVLGTANQVVDTTNRNLTDLLLDTYREMTKSVELKIEGIPDIYKYQVDTLCTQEGQTETVLYENQMFCDNPRRPATNNDKSEKVIFKLRITLPEGECPEPAKVTINTPGYGGSEKVTLILESNCECEDCTVKYSSLQCPAGPECNGHGNFECGKCLCDEGWGGDCCDCQIGDQESERAKEKQCFPKNMDKICSGRGECQCGKCICKTNSLIQNYNFGEYCQCTLDSCPKQNGKICNDHGTCQCGTCYCDNGWSGENCGCDQHNDQCAEDGSDCNGNGECSCNKCQCLSDTSGNDSWEFKGRLCETLYVNCDAYDDCKDGECPQAKRINSIPKDRQQFVRDCTYQDPSRDVCEHT